uniref:Uncharacterized protein n=1 Tax=Xiphophorus maculatus TaxID=8083 RepID=M4AT00_XIPMA
MGSLCASCSFYRMKPENGSVLTGSSSLQPAVRLTAGPVFYLDPRTSCSTVVRSAAFCVQAPLGRARSRGLTIPGPDFTYGASTMMRDGSVTEAEEAVMKVQCPDFVVLNRDAVRSGLVTAKELRQYRLQMGDLQIQAAEQQQRCRTSRRPHLVPDITFGIRNRPSSPLADVLAHHYGHRWLEEQLTHSSVLLIGSGGSGSGDASLLPLQIPAALDTFRDSADRKRAASAQQQNR